MELKLKFRGIDDFNRPVFKSEKGAHYGSVQILFPFGEDAEKVISEMKNRKAEVVYFGAHFNCEPDGTPLKKDLKVILTP